MSRSPLRRIAPTLLLSLGALYGCNGGEDSYTVVGGGPVTNTTTPAPSPTPAPEQVTGLLMPAKLSIVTAQSDTAAVAGLLDSERVNALANKLGATRLNAQGIAQVIDTSLFPADADYNSDAVRAFNHVYDPSMEPLNTVNMILCLMDQTQAEEMINQGPYIALVNEIKCENSGGQQSSSNQGGVSNTQNVRYNKWTIISERADNASSQKVSIWVPGGEPDPMHPDPMEVQDMLIEVEVIEGVSAAKPFGDFVLNFLGVVPDAGLFNPTLSGQTAYTMVGSLRTLENASGAPQFDYINLIGDVVDPTIASGISRIEKTNVVKTDATGENGIAKTYIQQSAVDDQGFQKTRSAIYNVAFNPQYYLRNKTDLSPFAPPPVDACTQRDNFSTMVWSYNLYHKEALADFNGNGPVSAGQRVNLNSGFPFTYASTDSAGNPIQAQGHVGYWGIWSEYSDTFADGAIITSQNFQGGQGEAHRINLSDGKMWHRNAVQAPITDMIGQTFTMYYWDFNTQTGSDYAIRYNSTAGDMEAYATVVWDVYGPVETPLTNPVLLGSLLQPGEKAWMYSDALGGELVYTVGQSTVTFYKQNLFGAADLNVGDFPDYNAGSNSLPLICYEFCPRGGVSGTPTLESDLFYPSAWDMAFTRTTPYRYTLVASNGTVSLIDENGATPRSVSIPQGTDMGQIRDSMGNLVDWFQWGIRSGQLVPSSQDPGINNWWAINDLPSGFNWETGPNASNRQTAVTRLSDGQLLSFDEPLQFQYSYQAGDDPNIDPLLTSHPAGNTLLLEYGGAGQLWGFPWAAEPGCDSTADSYCRWVPEMTLADGVQLSSQNAAGVTHNFVVRSMDKEQYMRDAATGLGTCTSVGLDLTPARLLELPYTTSSMVGLSLADKPVITDPPAVIEGVLQ